MIRYFLLFTACILNCDMATGADSSNLGKLQNQSYQLETAPNASLTLKAKGVPITQTFAPTFTIISPPKDPKYRLTKEPETAYAIPNWKTESGTTDTFDLFSIGSITSTTAVSAELKDGRIQWKFPDHPRFTLEAELSLPDELEPQLTFRFTPKKPGWYSIGYTGAPAVSPGELKSLWQPLVWQELRFPARSYLSVESLCSLPAVLAEHVGATVGLAADPAEIPFRMPDKTNSRFGVALRNQAGDAQPMLFAPVPGLPDSKMVADKTYTFRMRLVLQSGDCNQAFRSVARGLYGFHDYRDNGPCSLNQTLENMIDFAMNDTFSGWVPDLKGSDYITDVPGTVKNVSALHPLSIALITDNRAIYQRRALPMTEYLLSRQKYLFATRPDITRQSASYWMKGPAAEVSELVSLFHMFGGRSEILRHYALDLFDKPRALNLDMVSEGASWQNALALYRLTHDRKFLEQAVAGANEYITKRVDRPQRDFEDVHVKTGGQFWTDFAPKWADLIELHEETKNPRHLRAALAGARTYTMYAWMHPRIPEGEVVINKGNQIGIHYRGRIPQPQPMRVPEQSIPAWRVSQIGLIPEASTTHAGNPAVFLAHHAAGMLRLGHLDKDTFLHDAARAAIVGRYANFPGYDISAEFTNVYARADYPLRPWRELTYNNIYYNHIWPNIALVMDFLVSDVYVKSDGGIDFPSRYAQGYAYLFCKVYGDRPGSFYGDKNVRLWMPRQVVRTDNVQVNTVTGYGNDSFYIALLNQSGTAQKTTVEINPDLVPCSMQQSYTVRTWKENKPGSPVKMEGGRITADVAPHGITAFAIDGVKVIPQFQSALTTATPEPSRESFAFQDSEVGKMTAMLLSPGEDLTNAFVWLQATPREISQAMLTCKAGDVVTTHVETVYPFEFSVPLPAGQNAVDLIVETTTSAGVTLRFEPVHLKQ